MSITPRPISAPPLLQFLLRNLPQLINLRRLPCHHPLDNLRSPPQKALRRNRIRRRLRLYLDNANTRVFGPAVVLAVLEVAEPGFEAGGVVFADHVAVGDDGCFAGDGGPFASGVEEGDVDFGVGFEVVGFAGFGVGVEEEVDAAAFLLWGMRLVGV